jgi:hypothetical protein
MVEQEIPQMIDPLGESWEQPKASEIVIDRWCAVMTRGTFMQLKDYSLSLPTGVYAGKMWRLLAGNGTWWLCWYGPSDHDQNSMGICLRQILLLGDN